MSTRILFGKKADLRSQLKNQFNFCTTWTFIKCYENKINKKLFSDWKLENGQFNLINLGDVFYINAKYFCLYIDKNSPKWYLMYSNKNGWQI